MRQLLSLLLLFSADPASAQTTEGRMNVGFMANLNTSQMKITGGFGRSITTGTQWSAGFGIYFKSAVKNRFRLEAESAFEATGSGKETYYERSTYEWVRIYDRYRTIPFTLKLDRSLGETGKWSVGAGFKSSFVVGYSVRHESAVPNGSSGIILSPVVKKWFGSPVIQLTRNFATSDVSLCGWYAISPLIDQYGVTSTPFGISFAVKARLITYD